MDRPGACDLVTQLAKIVSDELLIDEAIRQRLELRFTQALRSGLNRCKICGGLVRYDGTKPGSEAD